MWAGVALRDPIDSARGLPCRRNFFQRVLAGSGHTWLSLGANLAKQRVGARSLGPGPSSTAEITTSRRAAPGSQGGRSINMSASRPHSSCPSLPRVSRLDKQVLTLPLSHLAGCTDQQAPFSRPSGSTEAMPNCLPLAQKCCAGLGKATLDMCSPRQPSILTEHTQSQNSPKARPAQPPLTRRGDTPRSDPPGASFLAATRMTLTCYPFLGGPSEPFSPLQTLPA